MRSLTFNAAVCFLFSLISIHPSYAAFNNLPVIDLAPKGIVCDGTTDIAARLQAAIDANPASRFLFPAGICISSTTIYLSDQTGRNASNSVFVGAGAAATTIQFTNDGSGSETDANMPIGFAALDVSATAFGASGMQFIGLNVYPPKNGAGYLFADGSSNTVSGGTVIYRDSSHKNRHGVVFDRQINSVVTDLQAIQGVYCGIGFLNTGQTHTQGAIGAALYNDGFVVSNNTFSSSGGWTMVCDQGTGSFGARSVRNNQGQGWVYNYIGGAGVSPNIADNWWEGGSYNVLLLGPHTSGNFPGAGAGGVAVPYTYFPAGFALGGWIHGNNTSAAVQNVWMGSGEVIVGGNVWNAATTFNYNLAGTGAGFNGGQLIDLGNNFLNGTAPTLVGGTTSSYVNYGGDAGQVLPFTPGFAGSSAAGTPTITAQVGRYTHIGNRYDFTITLTWSATTGMTGNVLLTNLPTALLNVANVKPSFVVSSYSGITLDASYTQLGAQGILNTQTLMLTEMGSGQAGQALPVTALGSSGSISLSGTVFY